MTFNRPLWHPAKASDRHRLLGPGTILLAAAVATVPILLHGPFCGDDFEFHVVSWFDAQQSWLHGAVYPHWMSSANFGAGEPRFEFYPPVTWMLGASLGFLLPWQLVPVAMIYLSLAGVGLATLSLARIALPGGGATLSGCAAVFSGFALFTAYQRTAFAELMGGICIPLLLLFALRRKDAPAAPGRLHWTDVVNSTSATLAVVLAGAWLCDGPVGLMSSYLLAAVSLATSALERTWAPVLRGTVAAALGAGMAGFYLIPVAHEQSWVDLRAAADYPVFRVENNWLFARHAGTEWIPFDAFLHRASTLTVATIGIAMLCALILVARRLLLRAEGPTPEVRQTSESASVDSYWIVLAAVPLAVLLLQLPFSLPIWNVAPKLRFLQYPWRWTLLAQAPMAIFFAAAVWPSTPGRPLLRRMVAAASCLLFLASLGYASQQFLRACKVSDSALGLLAQFRAGGGLRGTDEYEPPDADHWKIAHALPDACFSSASDTTLGVAEPLDAIPAWKPEQRSCEAMARWTSQQPGHLRLSVTSPRAGFLILKLVSFPHWKVRVNGQEVAPADPRDDGLIAVPVPQGPVDLAVDWVATPDVVAGRAVSAASLFLMSWITILRRSRWQVHRA